MEKNKELLNVERFLRILVLKIKMGIKEVRENIVKRMIFCAYCVLYLSLWIEYNITMHDRTMLGINYLNSLELNYNTSFLIIFLISVVLLLLILSSKYKCLKFTNQISRTTLCNSVGEVPFLIDIHNINAREMELEFYSADLPIEKWEEKINEIEAALDICIVKIRLGNSRHRIIVHCVPYEGALPSYIEMNYGLIPDEEPVYVLGEGIIGPITINLANNPHVLIGGSTGSGKTKLLKLLLFQALNKKAQVYIADFKGGIDYDIDWRIECNFIRDKENLLVQLDEILNELNSRAATLEKTPYSNIDDYNLHNEKKYQRIIFACDEVAELLDKSGLSKEEKDTIAKIEHKLGSLLRLGRACNIHVFLATQRPDMNTLPGSLKSNIEYRICGKADATLSHIVLDNSNAAEKIPKHEKGLFVNNIDNGELFRAYYYLF